MSEYSLSFIKNLGYLYLAFAHMSDLELTDDELVEVRNVIGKYGGDWSAQDLDRMMEFIIHWYNSSSAKRNTIVKTIIDSIHEEIENPNIKEGILKDLISIAKADKNFSIEEKKFITVLGNAWGVTAPLES